MNKTLKSIANHITTKYKVESRSYSYMRFLVIVLYLTVIYLITFLFVIGRMLIEGVLLLSPYNTELSERALEVVRLLSTITNAFIILSILSFCLVIFKEYQEYNLRTIIKKYAVEEIK